MHAPVRGFALHSIITPAFVLALVLLLMLCGGAMVVIQAIRFMPGVAVPSTSLTQSRHRKFMAVENLAPTKPLFAGPGWGVMTRQQKLALNPLAPRWNYMTEAQKRRWLTLAETFPALGEEEQTRFHERMVAWSALTAQQRSQARLTFATAKSLSSSDIQSEWESYQSLPQEQKNSLAARAAKPRGAATSLKPVPAKRLAHVPVATDAQAQLPNPPKIILPATSAIRVPPAPAPVELAPAPVSSAVPLVPLVPSTITSPDVQPEDDSSRASDALPELYVN